MNYFKQFKNERFHDQNLIALIQILNNKKRIDLFEKMIDLEVGVLGNFISGIKKRDFDILLEFENYKIIIETKVDSEEGRREKLWQTEWIYKAYFGKNRIFLYITYGLSEYYIKERDNQNYGNGPFSTKFLHVGCTKIHNFIKDALFECKIESSNLLEWEKWLDFELIKREENSKFLNDINNILIRYKAPIKLTDYPVNRLNLFLPEFTIPFFYQICEKINNDIDEILGRCCLYPVGRGYAPTNDSVLNFSELWHSSSILTCKGLIQPNNLYFEFNEDFNLHLKSDGVESSSSIKEVSIMLSNLKEELSCGFNCSVEYYKQGAYVLFEWDINLLSNSISNNINNIKKIIFNALVLLK